MKNEYLLDFHSHFRSFKRTLFDVILVLLLAISFIYFDILDGDLAKKIFGIYLVICIGPAVYLHYCYYLENKDFSLKLDHGVFQIFNLKTGRVWDITSDNVVLIEIFASATFIKVGTSGMLPHEGYHYARIKTLDSEIILTSLLYPDLMDIAIKFRDVRIEYHKTFFASL